MQRKVSLSLAAASALALGVTAGPAVATYQQDAAGSEADIAVEDCVVESSKDISYVAFFADGEKVDKDESMNAETFDLASVEGIEDIDAVEVKSGTTVEDFDVDCGQGDEADDGTNESGTDDGERDDDGFASQGNSEADIAVEDCVVESSKDISYVAFFADGEKVDKDESMNAETFELAPVEGIEDIDAVEVKSGTTVEDFAIECGQSTEESGVKGDDQHDETGDGTQDETDHDTTEDGTDDGFSSEGNSEADIAVEDCVVESSKDISYVAFFADGEKVDKDESMNAETFELAPVEGIEDIDAVEVKSGTTVEDFAIECGQSTEESGVKGDDQHDETGDGTQDETDHDTTEDGTDDGFSSEGNSEADIAVEDCVVESSKDISYVAFFADGEQVDKDESVNAETFDLASVEGIEDIDAVEVKSGTTVEDFAIECGTA